MATSLPSQAARDALITQHRISLLQEHRPDDVDLGLLESLYVRLSSLWGQAIAAAPDYLPKLSRRPQIAD